MNLTPRIFIGFALGLWFGRTELLHAATNLASAPPPVPPPAMLRSPVDAFRSLLVMPAADRKAQLAVRPPEVRQKLVNKIREYQLLTPEERDLRLKATELQWYLKPLMLSGATNRGEQLEVIPENLREMVAARIKQWDAFPAPIQRLMLTNHAGPEYFVGGSATNNFPPTPPDLVRPRLLDRYNRLFELTPGEKEKVLATLSEAEQRQMQKTLQAYERLTPAQRSQCLRSFARFSQLSATERQEFLQNAERWSQMTPAERQAWRELVSAVPNIPPLPQLVPPLPPRLKNTRSNLSVNGG
jgi:hypothetical protein